MDVNPICEDRFERLEDQQDEVGHTLREHGQTLSEHGQTLEHHSRQLARLEEELGRQGDLLSQNQSTLAVLATKIGSVEAELLRLNGWQMKLIFLLVIALAAIAGVTSEVLYGKLMYDYDPAGGSSWVPDILNTSAITHLTFKSAEDMAGMTLTPIPYELSVTAAEATWFAEPISMRGADSVFVRVSGQVVQPGSGDPITLALKNQTVSY